MIPVPERRARAVRKHLIRTHKDDMFCKDPETLKGLCQTAAQLYCGWFGDEKTEVYSVKTPDGIHVVVEDRGYTYDFTHTQFDPWVRKLTFRPGEEYPLKMLAVKDITQHFK